MPWYLRQGTSFLGSGAQRKRAGSVAMSSSIPTSFVRAWCVLCLSLHQVGLMPPQMWPKGRYGLGFRVRV
jgi:hypothetical protein